MNGQEVQALLGVLLIAVGVGFATSIAWGAVAAGGLVFLDAHLHREG